MILRVGCHSAIMLGVTVGLTVLLKMSSEEFITIWLAFTSASAFTDWLTNQMPAKPSVLDLFERMDQ